MLAELKRALFKKSNLVLIIIIFGLFFFSSYYDGWRTSLTMDSATDLPTDPKRLEDIIFIKKYYGNVFRVWTGSYFAIQALAPIFLSVPFLLTLATEKANRFRYFTVARKGNKKYLFQKILAIVLSGTIILGFSELLFGLVSYFITYHDTGKEFTKNVVISKYEFFFNARPYLFFILTYLSHILYYFCFLFFAAGITSFLKNKIAIIITPFIASTVVEKITPPFMQANVVMQPFNHSFDLSGYFLILPFYLIIGIILIIIADQLYLRKG